MARLNHVKKARGGEKPKKCYRCQTPIKAGDEYYWFANRMGRMSVRKDYCKNHRPRASEMTTSDKLSQLYAAQEEFGDGNFETLEDMAEALRSAASVAESVKDEYQDGLDNMPDGLRDADPNGVQDKIDSCETWASELESAADEIENMEAPEMPDEPEAPQEKKPSAAKRKLYEAAKAKYDEALAAWKVLMEPILEEAQGKADDAIGSLDL